jgi:prephenate dehydratase
VLASRLKDAAGIAGRQAAREYGGKILLAGIEDDKRNYTRFFLLRKGNTKLNSLVLNQRRQSPRSGNASSTGTHSRFMLPGADKTSIAFKVKNVPGALFKALSVFALRDISLSKIESRPMRGRPWEYVFYVDFLRGDDEPARNALHHLGEVADFVKVLGIYPAA